MAFLVGSFGTIHQNLAQRIAALARSRAQIDTLQTVLLPHGILCAGQDYKHHRVYNHIFNLASNNGFIVGKLFDREQNQLFTGQQEVAEKFCYNPHMLYQHFWGRFVGALYNQATNKLTLVRDPLGLSTLFYIQSYEGVIFSTDMALLYDILETKPELDTAYFAQYIINKNQALASTPFKEIKELQPGMGLIIDHRGNSVQQLMWNITDLKSTYIHDEKAFEEELFSTLKSTIKAWMYDVDGLCIELSGGLDSSAVLMTLREVVPWDKKIIAVNYIDSKTPSSNEHEYAQEVADLCGVPLHLMDWSDISLLGNVPEQLLPSRPTTFLLSPQTTHMLYDFAVSQGCSEIVNGQGGDHIFLAPAPHYALADYWLDHGFNGIAKPLNNLSATYRMPWASLATDSTKALWRYYRNKPALQQDNKPAPFLSADYLQALCSEDFYLSKTLTQFYPAKATHIEGLCHAVAYADRDQRFMNAVVSHPLLSLPLVELGLKIPTYQSFNDTYDRIFFRRVASRMKQSKTIWRTIKGQTTSTMSKLCAQEANQITELLQNGFLIKSGIINKQWLDNELIKIRHGKADNLWPLLHMMTSQVWLNQWKL